MPLHGDDPAMRGRLERLDELADAHRRAQPIGETVGRHDLVVAGVHEEGLITAGLGELRSRLGERDVRHGFGSGRVVGDARPRGRVLR
jgi:hypothetical protein